MTLSIVSRLHLGNLWSIYERRSEAKTAHYGVANLRNRQNINRDPHLKVNAFSSHINSPGINQRLYTSSIMISVKSARQGEMHKAVDEHSKVVFNAASCRRRVFQHAASQPGVDNVW